MFNEVEVYNALKTILIYGQIGLVTGEFMDECEPLAKEGSESSHDKSLTDEYWTGLGEKINAVCVKHGYPPILVNPEEPEAALVA